MDTESGFSPTHLLGNEGHLANHLSTTNLRDIRNGQFLKVAQDIIAINADQPSEKILELSVFYTFLTDTSVKTEDSQSLIAQIKNLLASVIKKGGNERMQAVTTIEKEVESIVQTAKTHFEEVGDFESKIRIIVTIFQLLTAEFPQVRTPYIRSQIGDIREFIAHKYDRISELAEHLNSEKKYRIRVNNILAMVSEWGPSRR